MGFPPRAGSARRDWWAKAKAESSVLVLFEAPHRISQTLRELSFLFGERPIQVHRELTKINEELVIYTTKAPTNPVKELGEFVIVVGEAVNTADVRPDAAALSNAVRIFGLLTTSNQLEQAQAMTIAAKACELDEQVVRKAVKKHKIAENQRRQSLP
jgi:16S rRNA C1402 (ribose-2'-O) methylase RsmI